MHQVAVFSKYKHKKCLNSLDKLLTAINYHTKQPNYCQEGECLLSEIIVVSTGVLESYFHTLAIVAGSW